MSGWLPPAAETVLDELWAFAEQAKDQALSRLDDLSPHVVDVRDQLAAAQQQLCAKLTAHLPASYANAMSIALLIGAGLFAVHAFLDALTFFFAGAFSGKRGKQRTDARSTEARARLQLGTDVPTVERAKRRRLRTLGWRSSRNGRQWSGTIQPEGRAPLLNARLTWERLGGGAWHVHFHEPPLFMTTGLWSQCWAPAVRKWRYLNHHPEQLESRGDVEGMVAALTEWSTSKWDEFNA